MREKNASTPGSPRHKPRSDIVYNGQEKSITEFNPRGLAQPENPKRIRNSEEPSGALPRLGLRPAIRIQGCGSGLELKGTQSFEGQELLMALL